MIFTSFVYTIFFIWIQKAHSLATAADWLLLNLNLAIDYNMNYTALAGIRYIGI